VPANSRPVGNSVNDPSTAAAVAMMRLDGPLV